MTDTSFGNNHERIIKLIGSGYYFRDLQLLQTAIDKYGTFPKGYFSRPENLCPGTWGSLYRTAEELRIMRANIIGSIVKIIESQKTLPNMSKMDIIEYSHYFHALAILQADRSLIMPSSNDNIRNAFIELWKIDNGSDECWKSIDRAAWYLSQAMRYRLT